MLQAIEICCDKDLCSTLTIVAAGGGPARTFTGNVRVKPLFEPNGVRTVGSAEVSFAPCARTPWHTHPGDQTLLVTTGDGWIQQWGGENQAIQASVDGTPVNWLEHVTDDQYLD